MADVDIITTTYSPNADKLKKCLDSVLDKTTYVDYKWYLWANEPNEELKNIIHDAMFIEDIQIHNILEPIFNDNNDGSFASNNNEAAAEGSSEYILFLNDDIVAINNHWLHSMKQILDANAKIGVVGSLLLYPNKTIQHCGVFFSEKTNNMPFHMHYKRPINEVMSYISFPRYYQSVTAACMLVRRDDFEKVGGFNTEYFYSFEDVQLCLDISTKLKKRCLYCPQAQLIHNEGISGTQPRLKENVAVFRKNCTGKYFNDLDFYLSNPSYMVYNPK